MKKFLFLFLIIGILIFPSFSFADVIENYPQDIYKVPAQSFYLNNTTIISGVNFNLGKTNLLDENIYTQFLLYPAISYDDITTATLIKNITIYEPSRVSLCGNSDGIASVNLSTSLQNINYNFTNEWILSQGYYRLVIIQWKWDNLSCSNNAGRLPTIFKVLTPSQKDGQKLLYVAGSEWYNGFSNYDFDYSFFVAPSLNIIFPSSGSSVINPVNFKGSSLNADITSIHYGNTTSTATNYIWSMAGDMTPGWDFNYAMSTGLWWIKHQAINSIGMTTDYRQIQVGNSTSTYNYFISTSSAPVVNLISSSTFYCDNLPNIFYTTSTCNAAEASIIWSSGVNFTAKILQPAIDWIAGFSGYFSTDKAQLYASTTAVSVVSVWSFGNSMNTIFSNFPLFQIVLIFVMLNLAVLVFKGVWYLIKIIR